jgi:hypothetical protein
MMRFLGLAALLSACVPMPEVEGLEPCATHAGCPKAGELCVAGACWVPHAPCHGLAFDAAPSGAKFPRVDQFDDHMRLEAWVRWTKESRTSASGEAQAQLSTFIALPAGANDGLGLFVSEGERGAGYLPQACAAAAKSLVTTNGQVVALVQNGDDLACVVSLEPLAPERWHHLSLEVRFNTGPGAGSGQVQLFVDGEHKGSTALNMRRPDFGRVLCSGSDCRIAGEGGGLVGALADVILIANPSTPVAPSYPLNGNLPPQTERFHYWRSWELESENITNGNSGSAQRVNDCPCLDAETIYTPVCGE